MPNPVPQLVDLIVNVTADLSAALNNNDNAAFMNRVRDLTVFSELAQLHAARMGYVPEVIESDNSGLNEVKAIFEHDDVGSAYNAFYAHIIDTNTMQAQSIMAGVSVIADLLDAEEENELNKEE